MSVCLYQDLCYGLDGKNKSNVAHFMRIGQSWPIKDDKSIQYSEDSLRQPWETSRTNVDGFVHGTEKITEFSNFAGTATRRPRKYYTLSSTATCYMNQADLNQNPMHVTKAEKIAIFGGVCIQAKEEPLPDSATVILLHHQVQVYATSRSIVAKVPLRTY